MQEAYEYLNKLPLKYKDKVVVACSGGPDSMALLSLLLKLKKSLDLDVIVAHVNHNVRKESKDESIFVQKYCAQNNAIFETMTIENYGDDNFHNEARTIRYNYFDELVNKYHAKYLFTAHHGDDLMETILMRIVRGSTLKGYSGFAKVVDMPKYKIVRPLITVTKDEIYEYLKKNKIPYVIDPSNQKDVYTRNRFRKQVLPFLKNEDSNVHKKFYKFSNTLLEYDNYINKIVEKEKNKVCKHGIIDLKKFNKLEHLVAMKIIYLLLEENYQDDLMLITDHHASLLYNMAHSKKANIEIYLPNNYRAIKSYDTLVINHAEEKEEVYEIEFSDYVNLPNGKNIEKVSKCDLTDNNVTYLLSKEITLPLHVRTRQNGDKISQKGMLGRKKINDIFIDKKIPLKERDMWPVVIDSKGVIVWLPGLKKSKFDKTKQENYDIILKYY